MAIHPRYADAILDGRKRVEFRKRPLAADVRTVVIYATTPVKKIVGQFTVDRVLIDSPKHLWASVGGVGGIDEAAFSTYYAGTDAAVGIVLSAAWRYPSPIPLATLEQRPSIPQSFTYLPIKVLDELHSLVAPATQPALLTLVSSLVDALTTSLSQLVAAVGLPSRELSDDACLDKQKHIARV